jgi:outer membrane protein OmpA-like peptidoglycan-associated protein
MSDKAYARKRRMIDLERSGQSGPAMTGEGTSAMGSTPRHAQARGWPTRLAALLVAGGLLTGCSDAWDTVSRPLDPLPPADPQEIDAPQDGAGEYPNLSSVPDEPPRRPSRRAEREEIRESLSADRANARYSDQQQTGEGIEARERGESAEGQPSGAPERPEVAQRMPEDDADTRAQQANARQTDTQQTNTQQTDTQRTTDQRTAAQPSDAQAEATDPQPGNRSTGSASAPDVPQLQQSEQGEPIEVPAQPDFNGPDRAQSAAADRSRRAQQQQSASRQSNAGGASSAPDPEVGQSRTLSRQDAGGQTMADGGRRIAVIYFRHGASSLQGRARNVLRDVAQIYERQGRDLRVVGHASSRTAAMDPVDHRMANFDTSLKRAQAVVDALVAMGVPRDAIQLEARGDNEPVYHEFMPTGEAGNRRAEIFLQG